MAVAIIMVIAANGKNPRVAVVNLAILPMVPYPTVTPMTMMKSEEVVYTLAYLEGSLLVQFFISPALDVYLLPHWILEGQI